LRRHWQTSNYCAIANATYLSSFREKTSLRSIRKVIDIPGSIKYAPGQAALGPATSSSQICNYLACREGEFYETL
jgi:hypothetical protein